MMDQFKRVYMPGGMGLDHSCWMLVFVGYDARYGTYHIPLRRLARSDYK